MIGLLLICLFAPSTGLARISGDKFTDPDSGFSISKPADWEFVQTPKAKGLKLNDESVMKAVNKTIVTFAKNVDVFGVKPTVGVERLTLAKGKSPLDWLKEELQRQSDHSKNFQPGSQALITTVDQVRNAARASYVNTTVVQGREVRVYHILYVVPSSGRVYLVHMNCNEGLASQYVDVFGKIADSIVAKPAD